MLNLQNTVLVFLFSFSCLLYTAVLVDLQLLDVNGLKTLTSKMHADASLPKNLVHLHQAVHLILSWLSSATVSPQLMVAVLVPAPHCSIL